MSSFQQHADSAKENATTAFSGQIDKDASINHSNGFKKKTFNYSVNGLERIKS